MTELEQAAEIIRRGGLVAFPTETVYGLGANALDAKAVERIFVVKGRPATSPLIVHVSSITMAKSVVREWPDRAERLASRFWPGPLTLVLPKQSSVPDRVTASLDTVGVRMPSHPLALSLIESAGVPIAAPSANRFTQVSATTAEHVRTTLGAQVDLILDGGPTKVGIESTVVALHEDGGSLLRPGMVSRAEIEAVIGPIEIISKEVQGPHASPGLHRRHYSPRKPVILTSDPPIGNAFLWWNQERPSTKGVRMPSEPGAYARELYAQLHKLDRTEGISGIAVEPVPLAPEWDAIRDRLSRAQAKE